jgi:hypothetical protein
LAGAIGGPLRTARVLGSALFFALRTCFTGVFFAGALLRRLFATLFGVARAFVRALGRGRDEGFAFRVAFFADFAFSGRREDGFFDTERFFLGFARDKADWAPEGRAVSDGPLAQPNVNENSG